MIVVVAALKGGVGKTTTSVYLSAVAVSNRRAVTLISRPPTTMVRPGASSSARSVGSDTVKPPSVP